LQQILMGRQLQICHKRATDLEVRQPVNPSEGKALRSSALKANKFATKEGFKVRFDNVNHPPASGRKDTISPRVISSSVLLLEAYQHREGNGTDNDVRQAKEYGFDPSPKWFVLALVCTFSVGSQYSQDCIGPLKDILKRELAISDAQISIILGSNLVANTVVPIVAGALVARFGTINSSLYATGILFLGQGVTLLAALSDSVPGMIFGLCLFG
jgi:hypothetical protein